MGQRFEIPDPDFAVQSRRVAFGASEIPVDVLFRGRLVFTYTYKGPGDFPDYELAEEEAVKEFAAKLQRLLGEA